MPKDHQQQEIDLCLSGGGSKFISQVSFVKTIIKSKRVRIRNIYACSAGSLVAPFIIADKLEYLEKYYFNLPSVESQLVDWNWFCRLAVWISSFPLLGWVNTVTRLVVLLFAHGAYKGIDTNILNELNESLTQDQQKRFDCIRIVTTSLTTGQNYWFKGYSGKGWHWIDAVRASCALMPIMPPVSISGELYVDGGITDVCPLENACVSPSENDPNGEVHTIFLTYDYLTRENYTKQIRLGTTIITYLQDLLFLVMAHSNRQQLSTFLHKHKDNNNIKVYTSAVEFESILDFDMDKRKQLYDDGVRNANIYLDSLS